jgi:hypothetical protein
VSVVQEHLPPLQTRQVTATTRGKMPSRTSPTGFKPLEDTKLFQPLKLGALRLEHRVMMAPLTRMRAPEESQGVYVPSDLNVEYYSQRASKGGFQLTEACPISRYVGCPEVETPGGLLLTLWS